VRSRGPPRPRGRSRRGLAHPHRAGEQDVVKVVRQMQVLQPAPLLDLAHPLAALLPERQIAREVAGEVALRGRVPGRAELVGGPRRGVRHARISRAWPRGPPAADRRRRHDPATRARRPGSRGEPRTAFPAGASSTLRGARGPGAAPGPASRRPRRWCR
jgi:hypothetical protein